MKLTLFKLSANLWPQRWMQISVMLDAGLSVEQALKTLSKTPNHGSRDQLILTKMIQGVSKGSMLTTTFLAYKIIDKFDGILLETAEVAGRLPQGLEHISKIKIARQKTIKTLFGLTLLPKAILLIGALAGIFVRTAQQGQSLMQALLEVGIVLLLTFIAIQLLITILTIDARIALSLGWRFTFLRQHSRRFQQHFEQRFYHNLIWQLASGIDIASALKRNALILKSKPYQAAVKKASKDANDGIDLATLLEKNDLVFSKRMQQTLSIADASGTAEKAISHELKLINQEINQRTANLISWWPRALYIAVLLVIVNYIV